MKPDRIAASMGIKLVPMGGGRSAPYPYSGHFRDEPSGPVIEYNMLDSLTRQRFTIAHEIAHCALDHGTSPRDPAQNFGSGVLIPKERDANQFAAELLMPQEAVVGMISQGYRSVESLAKVFMVSPAAMGYRLTNLSLSL